MKFSTQWFIALTAVFAPLVLLLPIGLISLWEHGFLLLWLSAGVGCSLIGWGWSYYLRRKNITALANLPEVEPNAHWSDTSTKAWQKVTAMADSITVEQYPFTQREKLMDLGHNVLKTVADHYHPESNNSLLEIPLPYLLRIVELVSADLRTNFVAHVPGSHIITINTILRGYQFTELTTKYYNAYRVVAAPISPATSLLREVKDLLSKKLFRAAANSIKLWLLQTYVKKVGYYAIELYSGKLVLDEITFKDYLTEHFETNQKSTQSSLADTQAVVGTPRRTEQSPLRFLVLGQVKAGKSSLVNAILGETKAVVDVLPQSQQVTPYLINREEVEQALLLDSDGYEDETSAIQLSAQLRTEILRSDFIFLVCNATAAARQADKQLLEEINYLFQIHLDIAQPPLLIVLTHIDQLRPVREWRPPYNIANPDSPKARTIRHALETVGTELTINLNQIIPVNLKSTALFYNVKEGVIPALLNNLDEAKRIRYLRCIQAFKKAEYWQLLWSQACNAGAVIANTANKINFF